MGARRYKSRGRTLWLVDITVKLPDGTVKRIQQRRIPTREQAEALIAKLTAEAFEGKFFDRRRSPTLSVGGALDVYLPLAKRDNDSWRSDESRAKHLRRHLGPGLCTALTRERIDQYRTLRFGEDTRRKSPPSPASLDREVELLARVLSYCVSAGHLEANPLKGVPLLRKPNTRSTVLPEEAFQRLMDAARLGADGRSRGAAAALCAAALLSYDTGMRQSEVLSLRWEQVDLRDGMVRLSAAGTKEERPRNIALMRRTIEALRLVPRVLHSPWVFTTSRPTKSGALPDHYKSLRGTWAAARVAAGLDGAWFHDLRRSFATLSRRVGTPESVVMQSGGWRTPSAFRRYNIVDPSDMKAAAQRREQAINAEKSGEESTKNRTSAGAAELTRRKT